MSKKIFIGTSAAVLLIAALTGAYFGFFSLKKTNEMDTQKVYRVGIFSGLTYFDDTITGFKQKMTDLGYVEGQNITYDIKRGATPVGNQALLQEFVGDQVDLIFVFPTEASLEAKEVARESGIPIIATGALMEGNGLIENIQHPGGNLTGVRFPVRELASKRLEVLHELAPEAKRIWIPYLKDYPTVGPGLETIKPLAQSLGLTLIEAPFTNPAEVEAYLKALPTEGDMKIDAILFLAEPLGTIPTFLKPIYTFAEEYNIPAGGARLSETSAGSMFDLVPDNTNTGMLAAPLADKIFKGIPASTIPIVTPDSVLQINNLVVERLGLKISESLLSTAKKIVH